MKHKLCPDENHR